MALKSMTGFATMCFDAGGERYECKVRALNRKYLELTLKLPEEAQILEQDIRRMVAEVCIRGDITITVTPLIAEKRVVFDEEAALEALNRLKRLSDIAGLREEPTVSAVLAFPEVLRPRKKVLDSHALEEMLDGIQKALHVLDQDRTREGLTIEAVVRSQLAAISDSLNQITHLLPSVRNVLLERARTRLQELLAEQEQLAPISTISMALATLAERMEVLEELTRLQAHLCEFEKTLGGPPPQAKKLDFLCQEMLREANTLAVKAQDPQISHHVVNMKVAIERIREQLQNCI